MKKFKFKVKDNFFNTTFEGETEGENLQDAKIEVIEWYAQELDTDFDGITVLLFEEI